MEKPIIINKINFNPDYKKLDKEFDFFVLSKRDPNHYYFSPFSRVLDLYMEEKNVVAVRFGTSKGENTEMYVIMDHKNPGDNKDLLDKAIVACTRKDGTDEIIYSTKVPSYDSRLGNGILENLLMYALGTPKDPALSFNNTTGRFYVFHEDFDVKYITVGTGRDKTKDVYQVTPLEIQIVDGSIQLFLRSFTKKRYIQSLLNKRIAEGRRYNYYNISIAPGLNSIRRHPARKGECDEFMDDFVNLQREGRKSTKNFFNVYDYKKLYSTKMGLLHMVITESTPATMEWLQLGFNHVSALGRRRGCSIQRTKRRNLRTTCSSPSGTRESSLWTKSVAENPKS
ncbi:MAG: hypothetical protein LUD51_05245 [Clostridia bacterium]|nr:hypothetical protein [Clostridia bacterium]